MRKKQDTGLTFLLVLTLITASIWVGLEIYHNYTRAEVPGGLEKYLRPLNPTFDTSIFVDLQQRTT